MAKPICRFCVPGRIQAKERARVYTEKRWRNVNGVPESYTVGRGRTPGRTKAYELQIGYTARVAMAGRDPTHRPVMLDLIVRCPPNRRFDLSNVLKSVEDALNGVVYVDDRQIEMINARIEADRAPAIEVSVFFLDDL